MYQLKPISREAVPLCLDKADRYRLLNEPTQAESICLDVLAVDPENQRALIILLLSLTDQFASATPDLVHQAEEVISRLRSEYDRLYYSGIVCERRAIARLTHGGVGGEGAAYGWIEKAMGFFEQAEKVRPPENDDALLRWNCCVRFSQKHQLHPEPEEMEPVPLGED